MMPSPAEIRQQMEKILRSKSLAGSDQLKRLLQVSVEKSLDGNGGSLKEYTLGVEAFGRAEGYDPKVDPIVRVQARRLRAKLEEYYSTEGSVDPIVIAIPKGGYAPSFEVRANGGPTVNHRWWWTAIGLAVVGSAVLWATLSRPASPSGVAVLPLRNVTGDPGKQFLADKMTDALTTEIAKSSPMRVVSTTTARRYADTGFSMSQIAKELGVRWVIEGAVGLENGQALIRARVVDGNSDRKVWANSFVGDSDALFKLQSQAATEIVAAIQKQERR